MISSNLSKPLPNLIDSIAVERLKYCNMESINANTVHNCKLLITRIYRLFSSLFIPTFFFLRNKINKGLFLFIRLRILWMVQHNQICLRNFPKYDSLYSSILKAIHDKLMDNFYTWMEIWNIYTLRWPWNIIHMEFCSFLL